jgi:hypothetical protein
LLPLIIRRIPDNIQKISEIISVPAEMSGIPDVSEREEPFVSGFLTAFFVKVSGGDD